MKVHIVYILKCWIQLNYSDWTRRGVEVLIFSSEALQQLIDTMPVMKIWGSSSTIDWKEKSPNDCP